MPQMKSGSARAKDGVAASQLKVGAKFIAPNGSLQVVKAVEKNKYGRYNVTGSRGVYNFGPDEQVKTPAEDSGLEPIPTEDQVLGEGAVGDRDLKPIPVNDDTKYAVPPKKSSWSGTSAALKTPSEVTEAYGKKDPAGFKKSFGKDREPTPAEEEAWENGYEDGKEDDPQKAPGNFNLRNAYRQGYLAGTKKRGAKDEDLKPIPVKDSFNDLVGKLERGGKSKEYATKIAGKVAAEKKAVKDYDLVPEDCEANIYYYKEQIKMAERQRAKRGDEETNADLHFYKEQLAMEERNLAKVKRGEKVVARDGKAKDADNTKARLDKLKAEYAKKPSAELKSQIERLTDYLKQLAKAQPDKYPFSEDAAPANDCCYFVTT